LISVTVLLASPLSLQAATIVVNSTADPAGFDPFITIDQLGPVVTLRDAVNAAETNPGDDIITFDPNLAGQTITLTEYSTVPGGGTDSALQVARKSFGNTQGLTIQGLTGDAGITIARGGSHPMRIFQVSGANTLTLNDLTIRDGYLPGGWGGGIQIVDGNVNVNRSLITANHSLFGGAIYNRIGGLVLNNTTIYGNTSSSQGGGLYLYVGSQATLNSVTIAGNQSGQAGGIYIDATPYPVMVNSIVANNSASINLPEIAGRLDSSSHHNVCSDPGTSGGFSNGAGGMTDGANNNILGVDPVLGPLGANGGPTLTVPLLSGSPAFETGVAITGITTDQRGVTRPQGAGTDRGAYERTAIPVPTVQDPLVSVLKSSTATFSLSRQFIDGAPVTRFGIAYAPTAVNPNPVMGGPGVLERDLDNPAATGGNLSVSNLTPSTNYSVVAYVVSDFGTNYSSVVTFTTQAGPVGSLFVTTLQDVIASPGLNSLRDAIDYAIALNEEATITFDPALFSGGPGTITLSVSEFADPNYTALRIDNLGGKLKIEGPGPDLLTIDGNGSTLMNNGGPDLEISGMRLTNGVSPVGGAAIVSANALVLSNVVVEDNYSGQSGGAVFTLGPLACVDTTFSHNASGGEGGAIMALQGLILVNCTFDGNLAGVNADQTPNGNPGNGGAVKSTSFGNDLIATNSTFINNHARGGSGGALSLSSNSGDSIGGTIVNSTITGNSADVAGGGIDAGNAVGVGTVQLSNTIISGNTAPMDADIRGSVGTYAASNCLIGVAPATLFGANTLAENGGSTQTIAIEPDGPAADGGDNSLIPSGTVTDQAGQPRISNGVVDIGAYEFPFAPVSISSVGFASFTVGVNGSFNMTAVGNPAPAFGFAEPLPSGLTLSPAGVLSGTPEAGTLGVYPLTLTASNGILTDATQNFTLSINEAPSLMVTTTADVVDQQDGLTSLREALIHAASIGGSQTITFAPAMAGLTIILETGWNGSTDAAALRVNSTVAIEGLDTAPGVTLKVADGVDKRHFLIEPSGNLTLENLTLRDGTGDNGGAIWSLGSLTARGCTFTANHATLEGGAIQAWGDSQLLWVENCTFAGNSCDGTGTAINMGSINMTLRHVTITGNTGSSVAVSIWTHEVDATNTLIAGNSVEGVGSVNGGSFSAASAHNLLGTGGSAGLTHGVNGNLVGIPASALYLGSLADNGGRTPTVALLSGSPAINSGTAMSGLTFDQVGGPRVIGGIPDIGSVEDPTGDSDPDRDNLDNVTEILAGTSPVLHDTDSDGFNDASEMLSGSNPSLFSSVPGSTRVERVLGMGPARGLDLSGTFIHAFNVGTNGAVGQAEDAIFTADNATGVTVIAPNEIPDWTLRDFGSSPEETTLESVFQSIRWADNPNTVSVLLDNLVPGRQYQLQLLFIENGDALRRFDVRVDGVLVADDFSPAEAQGIPMKAYTAGAVVHAFTASGTTIEIVLSGVDVSTPAVDFNPTLSGVTLEETGGLAPLEAWRAMHGLAGDGSDDYESPALDGVANLLKYAFNMAPNAGDLLVPNVSILPEGGTAGLPYIAVDENLNLTIRFMRRKASTYPGIVYTVETSTFLSGWDPMTIGSATVESIDDTWERVIFTASFVDLLRFWRMRVQTVSP